MLTDENDQVFLCLHKWGEHDHPTLTSPEVTPGNRLILYLRVNNLISVWEKARSMDAPIEASPHLNKNSGMQQFCVRDLDGLLPHDF